ncbi:MAG: hypothetical protein ACRD9S_11370 [Pyrinomonadaceae bacterium]
MRTARSSKPTPSVTIKACASTYVVFVVIFGTLLLLAITTLALGKASSVQLISLCLLAMAFSFFWIASFKLTFGEDAIAYRTFGGTKNLNLSEIDRAYVRIGYDKDYRWHDPPLRPVLETRASP